MSIKWYCTRPIRWYKRRKITSAEIEIAAKVFANINPNIFLNIIPDGECKTNTRALADTNPEAFGKATSNALVQADPESFNKIMSGIYARSEYHQDKQQIQVRSELWIDVNPQLRIQRPPASLMLRLAEILVSKKRYERDCMAALADWHEEYFEALDQKRGKMKMAAIRIRHTWAFFKATGWLVGLETVGKLMTKLIERFSGA